MRIIKYENGDEMQNIIDSNVSDGYLLVEVANVTEGNFLGFEEAIKVDEITAEITNEITVDDKINYLYYKSKGVI